MGQLTSLQMHQMIDRIDESGNAHLTVTYKAVRSEMITPMGNFMFDSDNPPAQGNPYSTLLMGMVGLTFEAELTPRNEIVAINGLQEALDEVMTRSGLAGDPQAAAMRANIEMMFGDDAMSFMLQQMRIVFPEDVITVGDTWAITDTSNMGMPLQVVTTYTVNALTDDSVAVGIGAALSSLEGGEPMVENGMEITYNVSGTQAGNGTIALPNGLSQDSEVFQDISGSMSMKGPQFGSEEPVEVPITVNTRVAVSSLE
jgi:hypothetical protein